MAYAAGNLTSPDAEIGWVTHPLLPNITMNRIRSVAASVLLFGGLLFANAATESSLSTWIPVLEWAPPTLPVQFKYGNDSASDFLRRCKVSEETIPERPRARRLQFDDPQTELRTTAEVRSLAGFDAVEWVLFFENRGTRDTPILEELQAAAFALPAPKGGDYSLHFADGSSEKITDFQPRELKLSAGITLNLGPVGGRSS